MTRVNRWDWWIHMETLMVPSMSRLFSHTLVKNLRRRPAEMDVFAMKCQSDRMNFFSTEKYDVFAMKRHYFSEPKMCHFTPCNAIIFSAECGHRLDCMGNQVH